MSDLDQLRRLYAEVLAEHPRTPSAGALAASPAEVEAPDGAAEVPPASAARRVAYRPRQARGLRHIARCRRCGAWSYAGACNTPHDLEALA